MSTNTFPRIPYRINSCLLGANSYRIVSEEREFESCLLEEMTDAIRQTPGRSYMRVTVNGQKQELWMVPFTMSNQKMLRLQEAVEHVMTNYLGQKYFFFPFDLVADENSKAYLIHPIPKKYCVPIRQFLPSSQTERWKIAISLFTRIQQLHQMGLTSNGISREQLRVVTDSNEVAIWFNETLSLEEGSEVTDNINRHQGFLSIPLATENLCSVNNLRLSGGMRDLYSAAVIVFYLLMYTHPFVGSAYSGLVRDDYLGQYHNWPEYILAPGAQNNLGNQNVGRVIADQWDRTVPELKDLFNGIFSAVTHPERNWDEKADYWDPQQWLDALTADAEQNDNESSRSDFNFASEKYHQV